MLNRKRALWFPQEQFEAPSGCIFKLRARATQTYGFFAKAVDTESGFVHRDYRLVLAAGRTSQ